MSEREQAIKLVENTPDYKIGYVIAYLQGLNAIPEEDDEDADDKFCTQLLERYRSDDTSRDFVSFEDAAKLCGVDINAIQN